MRYAHPFYFLVAKRDLTRDLREFMTRDQFANQLIVEVLRQIGFALGDALVNNPPPAKWQDQPTQLAHVDTSRFRPEDVVTTSTRWPVSDEEAGGRKRVARAYTDLEQELLEVWSAYFSHLSRDQVRLHPDLHRLLPPGFENRYDMAFREEEGACYYELRAHHERGHRPYKGDEKRTAAFLLHLPRLPKRSVGYVGMWSLDGTSTLVWAHLLWKRHADLLKEPGFVMAELVASPIPERPTDYRWMLDWRAEILFRAPLEAPDRKQLRTPPRRRGDEAA